MKKRQNKSVTGVFCHLVGRIGILLTAVLSLVLLASAYGGLVDPRTTTKAAILTLGLPYLAMLTAVVAVVWLVLRQWRYALVPIAAIAIAWSPISRAVPVNVLSKGRDESKKTLKVMSFNAKYFSYNEDADGDGIHDAVKFLLSQDADIVAIQEGNAGKPLKNRANVGDELYAKLLEKYPYHVFSVQAMSLFSRYPVTYSHYKCLEEDSSSEVVYKINVDGEELNLISLHLQSIHLNNDDKDFFVKNTRARKLPDREVIDTFRQGIVRKLSRAFINRASQAEYVRKQMDELGSNLIVCGDFNDTPASWTYRTICGDDMRDAYAENACGFKMTYHDSRFWLTIDHILYRGNMRAVDYKRHNVKISDHYPISVTFELDTDK